MNAILIGAVGITASATLGGCDGDVAPTIDPVAEAHKALPTAKSDKWSQHDDPRLFSDDLVVKLVDLPMSGDAAQIPWTGSYWPTYEDNINLRWDGDDTKSPAAKYGEAFGIEGLEDTVSKHHGIEKYSSRTACTTNDDCNDAKGEACAKRRDAEDGYCIPTWWGICHAWAPVAIMEPEPIEAVTHNGVRFEVQDIKALLTLMYNQTSSKFLSLRCNEDADADEISLDAYGNPTGDDKGCKDTNPGTFHIVIANFLGLRGESFVEDRTYDAEVWNQPLSGYRVLKQKSVSAQEANSMLGVPAEPGAGGLEKTLTGSVAKGEWIHFDPITVKVGAELLVDLQGGGEGDADLYVAFGAAPTADVHDCKPWLGASHDETCELTVPEPTDGGDETQMYIALEGYTAKDDFTIEVLVLGVGGGVPTDYVFNKDATEFVRVRTELDYITEAPASMGGNLSGVIGKYTHTDTYDYILELKDGVVQGGEWMGDSRTNHPDFLWLPTGRRGNGGAGGLISYAVVKSLLDQSVGAVRDGLTTEIVTETADIERGDWAHFGPYDVSEGALEVVMTGDGDGDLFVRTGETPTSAKYDCRPYQNGSAERCVVAGPGPIYVSVQGYRKSSVRLNMVYTTGTATEPVVIPPVGTPEPAQLEESGSVGEDTWAHFTLDVVAGQMIVARTVAAGDADLYLRMGSTPTVDGWDARAYTPEGNEMLTMVAPTDGVLHVSVHGYEATDFELTTAPE